MLKLIENSRLPKRKLQRMRKLIQGKRSRRKKKKTSRKRNQEISRAFKLRSSWKKLLASRGHKCSKKRRGQG